MAHGQFKMHDVRRRDPASANMEVLGTNVDDKTAIDMQGRGAEISTALRWDTEFTRDNTAETKQ